MGITVAWWDNRKIKYIFSSSKHNPCSRPSPKHCMCWIQTHFPSQWMPSRGYWGLLAGKGVEKWSDFEKHLNILKHLLTLIWFLVLQHCSIINASLTSYHGLSQVAQGPELSDINWQEGHSAEHPSSPRLWTSSSTQGPISCAVQKKCVCYFCWGRCITSYVISYLTPRLGEQCLQKCGRMKCKSLLVLKEASSRQINNASRISETVPKTYENALSSDNTKYV